MNKLSKIVSRQDVDFKLTPSSSNETSINLSTEISNFISDESGEVAFRIYKQDLILALSYVCVLLPLYYKKETSPANLLSIYPKLLSQIQSAFGDNDSVLYTVGHLKRDDGRNYLNGLKLSNGFNLRSFLIEKHTQLDFCKSQDGQLSIRVITSQEELDAPIDVEEITDTPAKLSEPLQQIFFGAPGTGKSFKINEACAQYENYRTTFHPDTDYASFVGSYKPITEVVTKYDQQGNAYLEKRIVYTYVFQAFLKAYIAAWREQQNENPKPVFLVVEEINRGNCAQIFGDIFQLLDRNESGYSDYPIVADDDLAQELKREFEKLSVANPEAINSLYKGGKDVVDSVKSGKQLLLPNNLYIWATMNTSDQSLFPIDSAFKRRWDWKYIKIKDAKKDYKIVFSNGNVYDWWSFVTEINNRIEGGEIQQEDKKLGYFFAKSKDGIITADRFLSKVIFFLYNDVFKDFGFDEDYFKGTDGQPMTFASYFDETGEANEAQIERFLNNLGMRPIITTGNEEDGVDGDSDLGHEGLLQNSDGDWVQPTFTVNGEKQSYMIDTVLAALKIYFDKNPDISTEAAISEWNSFGLPKHALETEETFNARPDISKSRASKLFETSDGRKFYVSAQLRKQHMQRLIEKAKSWGIEIIRVS
ncbi:MAG: AAA family ATPase [Odoribacter sp.]|nr:AAA family ATPase [Odoribacter sp.]